MKKKYIYQILLALIILALLFSFGRDLIELDIEEFVLETENHFRSITTIFLLLVIKAVFFFLPGPVLYTLFGMLLSPSLAFLTICGALFLNFSLAYFIGFLLGYDFVKKFIKKSDKLQEIFALNPRDNPELVFLIRLLPLPLEPVSITLGSTGIEYWKYIIISLLGMAPKLLIYVLIGHILFHSVTTVAIVAFLIILFSWLAAVLFFKNYWYNPTIKK
ncbi:TVP38/TMEM64 family protein [Halarsenatibacter silvermanii]|uniref:TVP38/TMEM64 family membrane protein n=1 Tax=Halarsenatibacter silvermanii TaxID=321763 RepID=A0A1G9RXN5_9FIRM|nr:VTT domain-containing protein [Halarsenatibacter silvermanii]SDM27996.1 Uncharacterized membrane protein YdjX, TVP38/TMEM64 family, SNARE-associated domain [Halarsenatibacter silvermanii]